MRAVSWGLTLAGPLKAGRVIATTLAVLGTAAIAIRLLNSQSKAEE
jgi:hypothetical protein